MAKKDELIKDAVPVTDEAPKETARQRARKLYAEEIPDYNQDDDEAAAEQEIGYLNRNRDANGKLAEVLRSDPRLAEMLSDVVSGKRGAAGSMVRYFGKDFLNAEEGTPEYEEIEKAEAERKAEMERMDASRKEYEDNLARTMPEVEAFCKGKGYNVDEFLENVWNTFIHPIMIGEYSKDLLTKLDNGLNYDGDVKDAMEAGKVAGRNMNINNMRSNVSDGLPKNMASQQPPAPKPRRTNSMLDLAKMA